VDDWNRLKGEEMRIMLVDDDASVRQLLENLISMHLDMQVIAHVSDGQAAVELARRLLPDVVVMDVNMPRLNGIDATRQIMSELPQTRIIGFCANDSHEDAMRQAGAVDFLRKPADIGNIVTAIRACMAS
jgi:DNA-binding NarL/FixJ family response regulator